MTIKDARLKRAELRARMAEEELTALLEAAVDAIIVIDQGGRVETFSHAAELMFGYSAGEVVGRNVSVLMPYKYASAHDGYLTEYQKTRQRRIIGIGREVEGQRKDGSVFPIDLAVGEFRLDGYSRYVGIIRDITERRQAEDALKNQRDQTQEYLDLAEAIMMVLNPDATIQLLNKKGYEILGYEEPELEGRDWIELCVPEPTRADVRAVFATIVDGNIEGYRYYENYVLTSSGERRLIAWHNALRTGADGNVTGVLSSGQDITEGRRAEREVSETRERLTHIGRLSTMGEMAAGLAHEINQPLSAIASYSQACLRLLESGTADDDSLKDALSKISTQAQRAGEVIQRLRAIVKNKEPERRETDCNRLLGNLMVLAEADARASGIALDVELGEDLPPVCVDPVQIQQVVLNLVRNAIDATLESGNTREAIKIRSRVEKDGRIEICVSDRGIGIPQQSMGAVFDPFFTTKSEGLGMGLSISRTIVRSHGGTLNFSANPGGGTVFELTLPAHSADSGVLE